MSERERYGNCASWPCGDRLPLNRSPQGPARQFPPPGGAHLVPIWFSVCQSEAGPLKFQSRVRAGRRKTQRPHSPSSCLHKSKRLRAQSYAARDRPIRVCARRITGELTSLRLLGAMAPLICFSEAPQRQPRLDPHHRFAFRNADPLSGGGHWPLRKMCNVALKRPLGRGSISCRSLRRCPSFSAVALPQPESRLSMLVNSMLAASSRAVGDLRVAGPVRLNRWPLPRTERQPAGASSCQMDRPL